MSLKHLYILRDEEPVAVDDPAAWTAWYEASDTERHVAETKLSDLNNEETRIWTGFHGIAHGWALDGLPILWETAVFYPAEARTIRIEGRYATRLDAIAGHRRIVAQIMERITVSLGQPPKIIYSDQESKP